MAADTVASRGPRPLSFVDRHDLWTTEQRRAAIRVEREIKHRKLEVIRFAFCDQHGVLRGKTLVAPEVANAMRSGVTMTSTLLAKDTSHRTVFQVFSAGGGMGLDEMAGAGNFVMVADPTTFHVLPWANNTGWMLCDIYFPNGKPVPFSTRALCRDALAKLSRAGRSVAMRSASSPTPAAIFSPVSRSNSNCSSSSIRSFRPTLSPGLPRRRPSSTPRTASST